MFFVGHPYKKIGKIPTNIIDNVVDQIVKTFGSLWKERSLPIMKDAFVLKARTPSNRDTIPSESAELLYKILTPLFESVALNEHDTICYADVSSLPAGKLVHPHIDYAMMHILSRRIHIPLITNNECKMLIANPDGTFVKEHLSKGFVYEINNMAPHAVLNNGNSDRWHVILDVISTDQLNLIQQFGPAEPAISPIMNWVLDNNLKQRMIDELNNN